MSDSIVHGSGRKGKPSRAEIKALLRLAAAITWARPEPTESVVLDEDAPAGYDPIDDPRVDSMNPAQLSEHYRGQMALFEPVPVAGIRRNGPITAPCGWRAAIAADCRSRRSDSGDRLPESHDPR